MSDGFRLFTCQRSHGLQKPSDSEPSGPSPHRLGPLALRNPRTPLCDSRSPFGNPEIPWLCPQFVPPEFALLMAASDRLPRIGPCFAAVQEYRSHRLRRCCRLLAAKSAKQIPTAFLPHRTRPHSSGRRALSSEDSQKFHFANPLRPQSHGHRPEFALFSATNRLPARSTEWPSAKAILINFSRSPAPPADAANLPLRPERQPPPFRKWPIVTMDAD